MSRKRNLGKRDRKELALMDGFARGITRPELREILEGVADQRVETFLAMMTDPAHSNKSLATTARQCGLTYTELTDMIKKYRLAEGVVRMAQHLPQIMEDVAEDARNTKEMCAKCSGIGSIFVDERLVKKLDETVAEEQFDPRLGEDKQKDRGQVPVTCPQCNGDGEVKKIGDAGARKLVFESFGLSGGKGPLISVQNNTANFGEDGLEDILKLGKPRPQALIAEVVKEGE